MRLRWIGQHNALNRWNAELWAGLHIGMVLVDHLNEDQLHITGQDDVAQAEAATERSR